MTFLASSRKGKEEGVLAPGEASPRLTSHHGDTWSAASEHGSGGGGARRRWKVDHADGVYQEWIAGE